MFFSLETFKLEVVPLQVGKWIYILDSDGPAELQVETLEVAQVPSQGWRWVWQNGIFSEIAC